MSYQKDQGKPRLNGEGRILTLGQCNGRTQCNRCGQDDAICVYTKRKRPNDKAYSKEYVQLLEEQQDLLVRGVKELYRRSRAGQQLPELHDNGSDQSLIHDILASLDMIRNGKEESDHETTSVKCTETVSRRSSMSDPPLQISYMADSTMPHLSYSPQSTPSTLSPSFPLAQDFNTPLELFDTTGYQSLSYFSNPMPKVDERMASQELSLGSYMPIRNPGAAVLTSRSVPLCIDPRRTSYSNVPPTIHHAYTT